MPAANTYGHHTLNEYRVTSGSVYESGSNAKPIVAAVVIAVFLGLGAYFYYSTPHNVASAPAANSDMNYQTPAANDSAPANTVDSTATPDAAAAAPATPVTNAGPTPAPAQDSAVNRSDIQSKANVAPAQRAAQPAKPATNPSAKTVTPAPDNSTSTTPDLSTPAPMSPSEPVASGSASPSTAPSDGVGG
jgi:hypothetical protein